MRTDACRHFTGIYAPGMVRIEACRAGVTYRDVEDRTASPYRLPCLSTEVPCPLREYPSAEEVARYEAEVTAAVDAHLAKIRAGICPTCGGALEPRRQVGRCIYGACGHRIGQGELR